MVRLSPRLIDGDGLVAGLGQAVAGSTDRAHPNLLIERRRLG